MEIGIVTDSFAHLPFERMLDTAAGLGLTAVELPTGGWSSAPHLDLAAVLGDAGERDRCLGAIRERGLRVSALNLHGNQLAQGGAPAGRRRAPGIDQPGD